MERRPTVMDTGTRWAFAISRREQACPTLQISLDDLLGDTMKYGMNLLLWTGEMNDGMMPVLHMLKSYGYDAVELPIFNTGLDYARWGKVLDEIGLARTAVTIRGAEDNPISPDAAVRRKGIDATKKTLD